MIFQHYINSKNTENMLEPLDYRNILDYLEYHRGTNQETIDEFYDFFMPYLKRLIRNGNYKRFMDSLNLLLDKIIYEYEWDGTTAKYLDTQYQYHLYYFRIIIRMVFDDLDIFYDQVKEPLLEAFGVYVIHSSFCFCNQCQILVIWFYPIIGLLKQSLIMLMLVFKKRVTVTSSFHI